MITISASASSYIASGGTVHHLFSCPWLGGLHLITDEYCIALYRTVYSTLHVL